MTKDNKILLAAFISGAAIVWFVSANVLPNWFSEKSRAEVDSAEQPVLRSGGVAEGSGSADVVASSSSFRRRFWTEPPKVGAEAALLADISTGETLMNVNPNLRWPIASLTKLMTAYTVLEKLDQNRSVTLVKTDFDLGSNSLTQVLQPGNSYRTGDLLKILLISSSNEAAEALARSYGRDKFLSEMNEKAKAWDLRDTHFEDPAGLAAGNQSTAGELKTLVSKINASHPEILKLTQLPEVSVTELNTGKKIIFRSTDQFAGQVGFLGGKTGTTPEAGENLISLWGIDNRPLLVVILGSNARFIDTENLLIWFKHDFGTGN